VQRKLKGSATFRKLLTLGLRVEERIRAILESLFGARVYIVYIDPEFITLDCMTYLEQG
jgi:hypothetical protein